MTHFPATSRCSLILTCVSLVAFAACEASPPPGPEPLRVRLSYEQKRAALDTWTEAGLRIDNELIDAEAAQDAKAIRMIRYRRAFAAEVLARLKSERYQLIVVDTENPPAPTADLLSTYGYVFRNETGNWAALIQVPRTENPELFQLFNSSKRDFLDK